jgi:hypothetical protein
MSKIIEGSKSPIEILREKVFASPNLEPDREISLFRRWRDDGDVDALDEART